MLKMLVRFKLMINQRLNLGKKLSVMFLSVALMLVLIGVLKLLKFNPETVDTVAGILVALNYGFWIYIFFIHNMRVNVEELVNEKRKLEQ